MKIVADPLNKIGFNESTDDFRFDTPPRDQNNFRLTLVRKKICDS